MIVVRDVFQAKYGKGGELVTLFKEARQGWPRAREYALRIYTDASGPFFTIVTETELPSLAEWEKRAAEIFADPEFSQWFGRMAELVESGRREFWNLE